MSHRHKIGAFDIVSLAVVTIFTLACILPMLLILSVSLTEEKTLLINGYQFVPGVFSLSAYQKIFATNLSKTTKYLFGNVLLNSYVVTTLMTLIGTIGAMLMSSMAAFTLSNKNVKYRNVLALYFVITMLLNTGIVPWYLLNRNLGLMNNFWALVIPSLLFNPFNMMLIRNYMNGLPESLRESARIDGAGDIRICFSIVMPLSLPVLAAVTLFYALGYWNSWFNAIMLVDKDNLFSLQYFLMVIKSQVTALNELKKMGVSEPGIVLPSESLKMATVIVTTGPIVLLYPILQRYFVKGLVVGGVKG